MLLNEKRKIGSGPIEPNGGDRTEKTAVKNITLDYRRNKLGCSVIVSTVDNTYHGQTTWD